MSFSVDNRLMGVIKTGDGYYRRGKFSGHNPWAKGGRDAPFDKEVSSEESLKKSID